ncbi:hypothetical protein [Lactobacillus intestinalis]|uniref:hypothetical protein n=1 Tax=Lactobacillus intestinalis TaxID=151781 RepID=UPI00272D89C8|nr:hypothetical protein [Lactobacillus intestinalis]
MTTINLGSKLAIDNKVTITLPKIKDKKFTLVFNDKYAKKLNRAMLELRRIGIEYDEKTSDEALSQLSFKEADKVVNEAFDKARETTTYLADQLLGEKGIGMLMFKTYGEDTSAVAAVLGTLNDLAENAIKTKNKNAKEARLNKYHKLTVNAGVDPRN